MSNSNWLPLKFGDEGQPENGDLFTIEEFQEMSDDGSITDDDGVGVWATTTHELDTNTILDPVEKLAIPSNCRNPHPEATHVLWFNK